MPPIIQYNADTCFRSVKIQNEILNFTDEERMETYQGFKKGYIRGHLKIVEIRARKLQAQAATFAT